MLFDMIEFDGDPRVVLLAFGAVLGVLFGAAAQATRFCLRRAIAGPAEERAPAAATWAVALGTAMLGFIVAQSAGLVDLDTHSLWATELPVLAILTGGLMFGVGMVLTRGCISRLTVLGATGNLRALLVLGVVAIVAHAAQKGVLSPLRTTLGEVTTALPFGTLFDTGAPATALALGVFATAVLLARRARLSLGQIALAFVIGLLPVLGWMGTSVLLVDPFDPLPARSLAFTLPWTETLFWTVASTAVPAGFGVGLVGGVLLGSFASAALRRELAWQSFADPAQTGRYLAGGALMGLGGVLAGGCTLGAGLSGVASQSVAAGLALVAIIAGAVLADRLAAAGVRMVPAE